LKRVPRAHLHATASFVMDQIKDGLRSKRPPMALALPDYTSPYGFG
jgi:hypothetical protein